jgi:hypothetical protein
VGGAVQHRQEFGLITSAQDATPRNGAIRTAFLVKHNLRLRHVQPAVVEKFQTVVPYGASVVGSSSYVIIMLTLGVLDSCS